MAFVALDIPINGIPGNSHFHLLHGNGEDYHVYCNNSKLSSSSFFVHHRTDDMVTPLSLPSFYVFENDFFLLSFLDKKADFFANTYSETTNEHVSQRTQIHDQ
jgi:hypothetical protein